MGFLSYYIAPILFVCLGAALYHVGVRDGYKQAMRVAETMVPKQEPVDLATVAKINEALGKQYVDEDLEYAKGNTFVPKTMDQMADEEEDEVFRTIVYGDRGDS